MRRSSGEFQVVTVACDPVPVAQDCAWAGETTVSAPIEKAIEKSARLLAVERRLLGLTSWRSTVENGDVSLPLDASTE